jgi:acyl carrier protein
VPEPAAVARAEERGFWTLLALAQAWGALAGAPPLHLAVIADGLFQAGGGDLVRPEKVTLLGPVRVLPQEIPDWTASAIDVVLPTSAAEQGALAGRLLPELRQPAAAGRVEPAVAWRGRSRSVRRFWPVTLPVPAVSRLRRGGAYLVAGALDETVLALAEHLFRTAGARLALLLPEEAPPRQRWAEWLGAYDDQDETVAGLRRLLALESAGCELLALPVELEDPFAVAAAVGRARERFGRLDGAIHAAGAGGAGLAQWKQRAAAAAVLGPKVRGLPALVAALAAAHGGEPLDLLLLCGSSLGATGGFGQVDTSAAAAFLSAFAEAAMARPDPPAALVQTIDWGFFRWQPVGGGDALATQLAAGLDTFGIGAGEMAEVVERVLASALPRVLVSTRDFAAVAADLDAWSPSGLAASLAAAPAGAFHPRPELRADYVAPRGPSEEAIAEVWQDAFGIERIGVLDDFFELAGNSLLAIQIVTRLSTRLGVQLPMAAVLETPTIAALAARVAGEEGVEAAAAGAAEAPDLAAAVPAGAGAETAAGVAPEAGAGAAVPAGIGTETAAEITPEAGAEAAVPAGVGTETEAEVAPEAGDRAEAAVEVAARVAAEVEMERLLREIEAMSLEEARQRLEGDDGVARPVGSGAAETA